MSIRHILNQTSFNFSLQDPVDTYDLDGKALERAIAKNEKLPRFNIRSISPDSPVFTVSQYNRTDNSKLNPVMSLKISGVSGLVPVFDKVVKTTFDYQTLLDRLSNTYGPTYYKWDESISLMLFLAMRVTGELKPDTTKIPINGVYSREQANEKSWVKAFEFFAESCTYNIENYLSLYLEYIQLLDQWFSEDYGFDFSQYLQPSCPVEFPTVQSDDQPAKSKTETKVSRSKTAKTLATA